MLRIMYVGLNEEVLETATLAIQLRWPDVTPQPASSIQVLLVLLDQETPDMVLIGSDLGDTTLRKAIKEIRRFSKVPLLVLGRTGDEMEVVASLELGADDYLRLPCELTEIVLRMWALIRRSGNYQTQEGESPITSGGLLINPATYEAFLHGKRVPLTATEFRLMYLLMKNGGTVVSHSTLTRVLWGESEDSCRLIKKYIQRLRGKLNDDARNPSWIVTIRGVGYRFKGPAPLPESIVA